MTFILVQVILQSISSTLHHSYSLIGLLRNTSRQPKRTASLHYGLEAPIVSP